MVEMASATFVCIVDDTKLVEGLGGSKLAMPVEIVQFCHKYTLNRCARARHNSSGFRRHSTGSFVLQ
jgi:ribose 5-phosphate isomerase